MTLAMYLLSKPIRWTFKYLPGLLLSGSLCSQLSMKVGDLLL
jgi:hypothetical protein